jgi:tRNA(Ile)-lysidine synthase
MIQNFQQYCALHALFEKKDRILLAVSGGVDSMTMWDLFLKSGEDIGVAHCNFQLRGGDSLEDEDFVKKTAEKTATPLHNVRFDTEEYAQAKGISIQMAARELRYNWFERIRQEHHYDFIATAHHRDDVLEGFFLNLLRKTGIGGLHGIRPKSNYLIHPLLFASKEDILQYAENQNIAFREDISNLDDHYQRNYIRHHIIPAFKELKGNFADILSDSIALIAKQEAAYKNHVQEMAKQLIHNTSDGMELSIEEIKKLDFPALYLFEMLSPCKFSESQIENIVKSMDEREEKIVYSSSHQLLKGRKSLIVKPFENKIPQEIIIEKSDNESFQKRGIKIEILSNHPQFVFENHSHTAYFDLDKLSFPLVLRTWKHGDYFFPFGGKGRKKISDLFTDAKLNSIEKKQVKLLCNSNKDIVWVAGMRSDNRYRVTAKTENILVMNFTSPP